MKNNWAPVKSVSLRESLDKIGLKEVRPPQAGSGKVGPVKVRQIEMGTSEIRPGEVRVVEYCPCEVSVGEVRVGKNRRSHIRTVKTCFAKVCPAEVRLM